MSATTTAGDRSGQPAVVSRNGRLVRRVPLDAPAAEADHEPAATIDLRKTEASGFGKAMLVCFVISIFMPNAFGVGSLNITPNLLLLVLGFLPLMVCWAMGKPTKPSAVDWLIVGFAVWASITRIVLLGVGPSIEALGLNLLQTLSAYMFGRVLVRDVATTRLAFGTAIASVLVMLLPLLLESATGAKVLLNIAGLLGPTIAPTYMDPRWGFQRAQGVFDHPILLGIFCASLVSVAAYMFRDSRYRVLRWAGPPATVLAGITSFSTGALLSMNIQFGLMLWGYVLRAVKKRWAILIYLVIAAYVILDTISDRTPFHIFVDYATFSSQSSYNRILIWQFGSEAVMQSPIFGHGTDEWDRPGFMSSSMDNFWLVMAYRYGLVGFGLLAAACLTILISMGRRNGPTPTHDLLRRGAIFSIVGTMVAITSVHLWNSAYVWFMFMLGAVSWMARPESEGAKDQPATNSRAASPEGGRREAGPRRSRKFG